MSEESPYRPRCKNLYCKSMLVYGEAFQTDPEYQESMTDFWCLCTSKGQGPDGSDVSLDQCSKPERNCFQEF